MADRLNEISEFLVQNGVAQILASQCVRFLKKKMMKIRKMTKGD